MSKRIQWALYKPLIQEGGLRETKGPSAHPERDSECIICHEDIEAHDQTLTHSTCSNTAHARCLQPWIQEHSYERPDVFSDYEVGACPMCRQPYSLFDAVRQFFQAEFDEVQKGHAASLERITAAIFSLYDDNFTERFMETIEQQCGAGSDNHLFSYSLSMSRGGYIKTFFGSDYLTTVQREIHEWTTREISALLLRIFRDRLRVLQAIAENQLSRGVGFYTIHQNFEGQFFCIRQFIVDAIMLRDGRLNNRRSQIAILKDVFKQEMADGEDEELVREGFKKILKQIVEDIKFMCLTELRRQADEAKVALDTMENMEMVYFFKRTGQWLPEE